MTVQLAVSTRNARLDAIETDAGVSPIMHLRSGAQPANCAAANSGTLISTINLPADWMAAASSGTKAKSGSWVDTSADAGGTIGHYRIFKSDGVTCVKQGNVTATGGGGDLTVDNTVVTAGQNIEITGMTWTEGNA